MSSEQISVFDIFKIGIGPSSSHTLGPWRAAEMFAGMLLQSGGADQVDNIQVLLYGSLAKTGLGHGTDIAVLLGLSGEDPVTIEVSEVTTKVQQIRESEILPLCGSYPVPFLYKRDVQFLYTQSLPAHPNALTFRAQFRDGTIREETYYSIGGGFVVQDQVTGNIRPPVELPFPVDHASDLLHWCIRSGYRISEIVWENERAWRPEEETERGLMELFRVIRECIYRGCHTHGVLPGGLRVERRAARLNARLLQGRTYTDYPSWTAAIRQGGESFRYILDWVSCFALAVNEENASFGRVVTAPTNGASGVIPAVLQYFITFHDGLDDRKIMQFLLTASVIGAIFKKGATISAAMGGCQAEIGVSSAMAAAALTESLGGTQRQVLMAAEIAMEHHLGLTCDPIGGLVQIPCIERNTMGAVKAVTAAQLALQSNPDKAKVSLDMVVRTMWETAKDMDVKYKETADGGLAVHIPISLPEC